MKITKYEELEIWNLSIEIALKVYELTSKGEFMKDYGLRDQIRRASVSISSNIAEGFEMNNNNDFIRFLRIAKSSAGEVRSQLYISYELGYINSREYNELTDKLITLSSQNGKFISYLLSKKNNKEFLNR